tara:strand:+ start:1128 stop:1715 length:588 start_codon:yes stop_codon:yes gene_type:complete
MNNMWIRGNSIRNRLSGLLIAIITIIGFSDSVWADGCVPEKLSQAEISKEVRKVQTTLMVAALSCGNRDNYNKFIVKFKGVLQRHGQVIKRDFIKRYGGVAGKKKLDKYVTALANEASSKSNLDYDAFCSKASYFYRSLKDKKPRELGSFVSKLQYAAFSDTFKPDECKPRKQYYDIGNAGPLGEKATPKIKKKD